MTMLKWSTYMQSHYITFIGDFTRLRILRFKGFSTIMLFREQDRELKFVFSFHQHATQLCAECIVNMVGLKVRMAATSASALMLQPNLVSVQLWNQDSLELASRSAAMTMIVMETRNVALMGVVMFALPQNTKVPTSNLIYLVKLWSRKKEVL